jgi:hypothetical protein
VSAPSPVRRRSARGFDFAISQRHRDNSSLAWTISVGPTDSAYTPTGSLVVGRWDHFAGTYDGTTMRIYQNGELVAEKVHPVGGGVVIDNDVFIGFWPNASGFAGVIGEVRIWTVVRSATEIKQWMDQPLTGTEPGLLGYWRLDEGAGQVMMTSPYQVSRSHDLLLGTRGGEMCGILG